jgi:hypothetical protein
MTQEEFELKLLLLGFTTDSDNPTSRLFDVINKNLNVFIIPNGKVLACLVAHRAPYITTDRPFDYQKIIDFIGKYLE